LIDKDLTAFPTNALRALKRSHEQWVSQEDFVPGLPTIRIHTYGGLALPTAGPATMTGEMIEKCRDHEVNIGASSRHELIQLKMRVQFPESIIAVSTLEQPVGIGVRIARETAPWIANAAGGGSVAVRGSMSPSNCFVVELERVVPARPLRFVLRTIESERLRFLVGSVFEEDDAWSTYAEGTFLYSDQGQLFERSFVVRLVRDENRAITAWPTEELGGQKRKEVSGFGF
jgi:hypothetical protein